MAILAAIRVFEAELPFPAQVAPRVAAQPQPYLVDTLVQPLHARVLAGQAAMVRGRFGGGAPGQPERRERKKAKQQDEGQAHATSVGALARRLKLRELPFLAGT